MSRIRLRPLHRGFEENNTRGDRVVCTGTDRRRRNHHCLGPLPSAFKSSTLLDVPAYLRTQRSHRTGIHSTDDLIGRITRSKRQSKSFWRVDHSYSRIHVLVAVQTGLAITLAALTDGVLFVSNQVLSMATVLPSNTMTHLFGVMAIRLSM
jgi:hypothetical protein